MVTTKIAIISKDIVSNPALKGLSLPESSTDQTTLSIVEG